MQKHREAQIAKDPSLKLIPRLYFKVWIIVNKMNVSNCAGTLRYNQLTASGEKSCPHDFTGCQECGLTGRKVPLSCSIRLLSMVVSFKICGNFWRNMLRRPAMAVEQYVSMLCAISQ